MNKKPASPHPRDGAACRLAAPVAVGLLFVSAMIAIPGAEAAGAKTYTLALEPTEGALLELHGPSDGADRDRGWTLDRGASSGLDHSEITDLGQRPVSGMRPGGGASDKGALSNMFDTPRLWGWGVRARQPGEIQAVLVPAATEANGRINLGMTVAEDVQEVAFALPLEPGERVTLELWSSPSTGANWRINRTESAGLEIVTVEAGRSYDPRDPTDWGMRGRVGAAVLQEWRLAPNAPGKARITLDYGRSWDEIAPSRRLVIDVGAESR